MSKNCLKVVQIRDVNFSVISEPGFSRHDDIGLEDMVEQNEQLGEDTGHVLAEVVVVEVTSDVPPHADTIGHDSEGPDDDFKDVYRLTDNGVVHVLGHLPIGGSLGKAVTFFFHALLVFNDHVELLLIVEELNRRGLVDAFGKGLLFRVGLDPWDGLTELELLDAHIKHFVKGEAVETDFEDNENPSKGEVLPLPVVILVVIGSADAESKQAGRAVGVTLAGVEGGEYSKNGSHDEIEPSIHLVREHSVRSVLRFKYRYVSHSIVNN